MAFVSLAHAQQVCAPVCDINQDGTAGNHTDYIALLNSFGKTKGQAGFNPRADLDEDGGVTSTDWGLMARFCPMTGSGG